jgi:hypothetical protein
MKPRAVTIADLDVDGGNCEQLQKCDHLLLDRKTTQTQIKILASFQEPEILHCAR